MVDFYKRVSVPEKQHFTAYVEFDVDQFINDGCHGTDFGVKPSPLALEFSELENGDVLVILSDDVCATECYALTEKNLSSCMAVPEGTSLLNRGGFWITAGVGYHVSSGGPPALYVPFNQAFQQCYLESQNNLDDHQKQIVQRFFEAAIAINQSLPPAP